MASTLTTEALNELADLLKLSRRTLGKIYRDYRLGSSVAEIAEMRGDANPKKVEESLDALRILFGRTSLPKKSKGRQQALNEAHYWVNSTVALSSELEAHFNRLLALGKKTNKRVDEFYEPLEPVLERVTPKPQRNGVNGRLAGVYVVTRRDYYLEGCKNKAPFLVKIGYSSSVWERIDSARTWFEQPLEVLRVWYCDSPKEIESRIHIALDALGLSVDYGGGTEWFSVEEPLLDSIASSLGLEDSVPLDAVEDIERYRY